MKIDNLPVMAVIEQAGVPALRVAFTIAVVIPLLAGVSSGASATNFSIAIQTSRTTCPLSGTIARK
jgi:hypothetical protein